MGLLLSIHQYTASKLAILTDAGKFNGNLFAYDLQAVDGLTFRCSHSHLLVRLFSANINPQSVYTIIFHIDKFDYFSANIANSFHLLYITL